MFAGFNIEIENTGERFQCDAQDNVLKAMERLGRKGIPVGCRGGGCGVCKVRVTSGEYTTEKMSRAVVSAEEATAGFALACRTHAQSDLRIDVVGKMVRAVMAGKSATFDFSFTAKVVVAGSTKKET